VRAQPSNHARTLLLRSCRTSWAVPRLAVERNGGGEEDGEAERVRTLSDKSTGDMRVDLSRTSAIQRLREAQGWTVFHYRPTGRYSKYRPPPGSARTAWQTPSRRPTGGPAAAAGQPQALHFASAWRSPRPPNVVALCSHRRQGHARHAVVFAVRPRPAASIRRLDPEPYVSSCPSRLPTAACSRTPVALVRPTRRHLVSAPESMMRASPVLTLRAGMATCLHSCIACPSQSDILFFSSS
jgi:hypothetical protein